MNAHSRFRLKVSELLLIPKSLLQLEDREKERVAFETMRRPDFDGTGGAKIQGNVHETWIDKFYKGWKQEPLLPLVPIGMKPLITAPSKSHGKLS